VKPFVTPILGSPRWSVISDDIMKIWDEQMEAIVQRSAFLCHNARHCPFCGTNQVQLKKHTRPAEWRCRICKKRFEYEPPIHGQGDRQKLLTSA
jgi:transposase-like protein